MEVVQKSPVKPVRAYHFVNEKFKDEFSIKLITFAFLWVTGFYSTHVHGRSIVGRHNESVSSFHIRWVAEFLIFGFFLGCFYYYYYYHYYYYYSNPIPTKIIFTDTLQLYDNLRGLQFRASSVHTRVNPADEYIFCEGVTHIRPTKGRDVVQVSCVMCA